MRRRSASAAPAAKRRKTLPKSSPAESKSDAEEKIEDHAVCSGPPSIFNGLQGSWRVVLEPVLLGPDMTALSDFVAARRKSSTVYPPVQSVFSALDVCPLVDVRVVILGQDPYHGAGQAHGSCFSVQRGVAIPPSLRNIFQELATDDKSFTVPDHGCLEGWGKQGVLLLNAVLTVEEGKANSHKGKGWEKFTNAVIDAVNKGDKGVVFMLWGGPAKKVEKKLDGRKHLVLTAAHPSPLSANRGGWFGCKHFSKANKWLTESGREPVTWSRLDD